MHLCPVLPRSFFLGFQTKILYHRPRKNRKELTKVVRCKGAEIRTRSIPNTVSTTSATPLWSDQYEQNWNTATSFSVDTTKIRHVDIWLKHTKGYDRHTEFFCSCSVYKNSCSYCTVERYGLLNTSIITET